MTEDHATTAQKARDELIRHRRLTVESLSRGYQPGETERQIDLFLKFQDAIAALDAVIDAEAPK
jgi:hypothetical protein